MCHRLEEAELSRLDRVEEACVGRHVTGQGVVGRSSEKRNREGLVLEPAVVALHFSPCVHRVHIVAPHAVGGIPGTLFLFSSFSSSRGEEGWRSLRQPRPLPTPPPLPAMMPPK